MAAATLMPPDEAERIAAVRRYDVLDTPPDGAFDRITRLAAAHFDVPISIVSIVDTDRIWFKSHHGVDVDEIGRDPGLCASAILGDDPWVVEDAATDPRTLANPLVAGELGLRFYAGAPLTTHDGHNLGTLCVIDQEAREFGDAQRLMLTELAAVVMDELELRLAARHAIGHELSLRKQAERMARALQESLLPPKLPQIPGAEIAALYRPADAGIVGGDFYDVFEVDGTWVLAVGDVSGKGPEAAALTGLARHTIRTGALSATSPADVLRTLNEVMFLDCPDGHTAHFCTVLLIFAHPAPDGLSITVAAGGHPPGLILHGDHSQSSVGASGTPAGVFPELQVTDVTEKLRHGDALVLFTDGLTEARTPTGLLGSEGVQRALAHAGERSAPGIVADLQELTSGPEVRVRDDVAALVLKVL